MFFFFHFFTDSCGDPTESFMRVQYRRRANIANISQHLCSDFFSLLFIFSKHCICGEKHVQIGRVFSPDKEMGFYLPRVFSRGCRINHGRQTAALNTLLSDQQKPHRPSRLAGENKMSTLATFILPNPAKEIKASPLVERTQTTFFFFPRYANDIPLVFS